MGLMALAAAAALLIAAHGLASCEPPTLLTITPDGAFDDWATVLANPRNVTFDGDGRISPCSMGSDRDCPVTSPSVDLRRFAWTYDETTLYFFIERFETIGGTEDFFIHLDLNGNELMEAHTDRLLLFRHRGPTNDVDLTVYEYLPAGALMDAMVDTLGYADGYPLPGARGPETFSRGYLPTGGPEGVRFESHVEWADLDLPGPVPFSFHLGINTGGLGPSDTVDNLGGPDDGIGSAGFYDHETRAPGSRAAPPGETIAYAHVLANTGNLRDRYRFRITSSEGYEIGLFADTDGDTTWDIPMAVDRRGDGDYDDSGDFLFVDPDGDTWPDTGGWVAPGGVFPFIVEIDPPNGAKRFTESTRIVTQSLGGGCQVELVDETAVGNLTLIPSLSLCGEPGTELRLCHSVQNHLDTHALTDLEWSSSLGWSYELWSDPDGDCDPSDGVPLFDTNGDTLPDLTLPALQSASMVAVVRIPVAIPLGTQETFALQALSGISSNMRASVVDEICVADLLELSPSYLLSDGSAKSGGPGMSLYFRHTLRWSGPDPASFLLSAPLPPGYATTLYADPNGDGHPADAVVIQGGGPVGPVAAHGGTYPLLLRLDIPPEAATGETVSVVLRASVDDNPDTFRQVIDQATVTRVQAYADPLFVLQENLFPLCAEIHVLAAGLVPEQSGRYRILWVDESVPAEIRALPINSDSRGEGSDHFASGGGAAAGPYSVRIEEWSAALWIELDRDDFSLAEPGILDSMGTDKSAYVNVGEDLLVWASFQSAAPVVLEDLVLRFLVLDPTGTLYLHEDGSFATLNSGLWTWTSGPFRLDPGEIRPAAFTIGPVAFPATGTYILQVFADYPCTDPRLLGQRTFLVYEDSDLDGWSDQEEAGHGTDPLDRDSDDDGILDPLDGAGDADGDTLVDALEADADADTLPDSVEAGLDGFDLDPDTDLAAGSFQPDGDVGLTTTNRLDPDTDGGGESDGAEDLDRDGLHEPGEKDPLDLTDDPCLWAPPREIRRLLVLRSGRHAFLSWDDLTISEPCVTYRILIARGNPPDSAGSFSVLGSDLPDRSYLHVDAISDAPLLYYLVGVRGRIGGEGPLGHYGE
jgi:hypothetical protein